MLGQGGIVGNGGGPYPTREDVQGVHVVEVQHHIVNELFHLHTGIVSTVAVASSSGDISIIVANDAVFTVGDAVQINNGIIETTFPIITAKLGGNELQFDRPLDFGYGIGNQIEVVHTDLSTTAGTLAAPTSHVVKPEPGLIWHIKRILISLTHGSAATDDKFGDQPALTNGVVLRASVNGQIGSFTNWKTNGDLVLDMYDVRYSDKAGSSLFGTSGRGSFDRIGATVELNGDNGDFLEILIQDDLTLLGSYFVNAQGYANPA